MMPRIGIQLLSPYIRSSSWAVALGREIQRSFDTLWMTDVLSYRNTFVLLAAVASQVKMNLGTNISFPYGRNPIDLATAAASISELLGEKEFVLGLGTGNRVASSVFERTKPISTIRESLVMIRRLFRGETVELDEYPTLRTICSFNSGGVARLFFTPAKPIPLVVGGVGPKLLRVAGELTDGVIFASVQPNQGLSAFEMGVFGKISGIKELREGLSQRGSSAGRFRMIYGINISVSDDTVSAREQARREAAAVIGSKADETLAAVGIDIGRIQGVRQAFDRGLGFDGAARALPDDLIDKILIYGTPRQIIEKVEKLLNYARNEGFNEFYIGVPVGPDLPKAIELITKQILPSL